MWTEGLPSIGLAACHAHIGLHGHVWDTIGSDVVDDGRQLGEVDVALERVVDLRSVRLIDDDVHEGPAGALLMEPGGGEIHVPRHDIARI